MTLDNQTGEFRFTIYDIEWKYDFPYGACLSTTPLIEEVNLCIGVVRAALKKAKQGV